MTCKRITNLFHCQRNICDNFECYRVDSLKIFANFVHMVDMFLVLKLELNISCCHVIKNGVKTAIHYGLTITENYITL